MPFNQPARPEDEFFGEMPSKQAQDEYEDEEYYDEEEGGEYAEHGDDEEYGDDEEGDEDDAPAPKKGLGAVKMAMFGLAGLLVGGGIVYYAMSMFAPDTLASITGSIPGMAADPTPVPVASPRAHKGGATAGAATAGDAGADTGGALPTAAPPKNGGEPAGETGGKMAAGETGGKMAMGETGGKMAAVPPPLPNGGMVVPPVTRPHLPVTPKTPPPHAVATPRPMVHPVAPHHPPVAPHHPAVHHPAAHLPTGYATGRWVWSRRVGMYVWVANRGLAAASAQAALRRGVAWGGRWAPRRAAGGYGVQLGVFSNPANARHLVGALQGRGIRAAMVGNRVMAGAYGNPAQAARVAASLRARGVAAVVVGR